MPEETFLGTRMCFISERYNHNLFAKGGTRYEQPFEVSN